MVPLAKRQAVCVGIMSYNGQVNFGLIGDYDAMPGLDQLGGELEGSLAELAAVTAAAGPDGASRGAPAGAARR
jgi:diacylglycerol O-acyltransferase